MCRAPVFLCTLSGGRFAGSSFARSITVSPDGTRLLAGGPTVGGNGYIDEFDLASGAYIADFTEGWSPRFAPSGDVFWAILDPSGPLYYSEIRLGPDDTSDVFVWADPVGATGAGSQSIDFQQSQVDGLLYVTDGAAPTNRRIYQVDPGTGGTTQIAIGSGIVGSTANIAGGPPAGITISNDGAVWFTRSSVSPDRLCRWESGVETQWVQAANLIAPGCVADTVLVYTTVSGTPGGYAVDPSFATTREAGYDPTFQWEDYSLTADGTLYLLSHGDVYRVPPPAARGWRVGSLGF